MKTKPELILKRMYNINCTGDTPYPVPELLILGNKPGLLWLAAQLMHQAQSINTTDEETTDPDDHQHISTKMPEVNRELSDEMEIRIGVLNASNRDVVLSKYEIAKETRKSGSLIHQYEADIASAKISLKKCGQ